VLAVAATGVALWRHRALKDLSTGSLVLVVMLALESYLGGLIRDDGKDTLRAVQVPLAMAIWAAGCSRMGRMETTISAPGRDASPGSPCGQDVRTLPGWRSLPCDVRLARETGDGCGGRSMWYGPDRWQR
jgi:hypothetical protein